MKNGKGQKAKDKGKEKAKTLMNKFLRR